MNKIFPSRTSLFLIELMISIFFFILSTTIVLQLFVKSYHVSQKTIYTNHAYQCAQNLAELFIGSDADFQFVQEQYSEYDCSSMIGNLPFSSLPLLTESENCVSELLLLYDKYWNTCTTVEDADFFVHVYFSQDKHFAYERISVTSDIPFLNQENHFEPLYELTIQKYQPFYTDISLQKGNKP